MKSPALLAGNRGSKIYGAGRRYHGSTATPFWRISKCRCGPVELPVLPARPINCPAETPSHGYHIDLAQVAINRQIAIVMVDHDHVSIASVPAALRDGHHACRSGPDRGAQTGSNIDPGMARPEIIAGKIMVAGRPDKAASDRSGAARVACAVQCTGARHTRDNPNHHLFLPTWDHHIVTRSDLLGGQVNIVAGPVQNIIQIGRKLFGNRCKGIPVWTW